MADAYVEPTMKAIVQDEYGLADQVLRVEETDTPAVGAGEVLVRVHAAGLDRGVWHSVAGLPYPIRLVSGMRTPKIRVPGLEVAGRVAAVGAGVTSLRTGDDVFGIGAGSFAEYVSCRQDKLAPMPPSLSFEQAAMVPVSGSTALQAIRDRGRVRSGHRVLIIGASGGVGTFAVQIGKVFGAEVTAVCSTAKVDLVRSLGADDVIDYTRSDFADGRKRYHVILDIGGNTSLRRLRRALTPRGRLVIVGGETSGRWLGGTDRQLRALAISPFVGQQLGSFVASTNREDLIVLGRLIEAGHLKPVLDRTFPLAAAAEAIRYLEQGRARGKVVITIDGADRG